MGRVMVPSLITVHYAYEKCGEIAAGMVMEALEQGESASREVKLGYYIHDKQI